MHFIHGEIKISKLLLIQKEINFLRERFFFMQNLLLVGRRKQINSNNHTAIFNGTRPQRSVIPSNKRKCLEDCHFRMIERCTWPQCNHSCPKLHNPFTGEEMDLIELLKSFGLDMKSVANALGIDIHTLISMDQEKLVNLLTQRAN